jgi:hypothetical protein
MMRLGAGSRRALKMDGVKELGIVFFDQTGINEGFAKVGMTQQILQRGYRQTLREQIYGETVPDGLRMGAAVI